MREVVLEEVVEDLDAPVVVGGEDQDAIGEEVPLLADDALLAEELVLLGRPARR